MTYFGRQATITTFCIFLYLVSSVYSSSTIGAKGRYRMYGAGGKRAFFTDYNGNDKHTDSQIITDLRLVLEDVKAYSEVLLARLAQIQEEEEEQPSPRTDFKKWQLN
ncbi:uncharacterized protein [Antedon mediterranea]|uniref:uncharacterized protein n=1 Tax=Antedon mediterranea TaxID=105859 RepID=UPI003AF6F8A8